MYRILLFAISLSSLVASAQNNLQNYTPSILFDKGDWEFKTFQNFYTQTKQFGQNGSKISLNPIFEGAAPVERETFFTSINQFLYGLNDQINVGFDVWIKASDRIGEGDNFSRSSGVSGFGPKVKIAPIKALPRLSIQSTFLFNPLNDAEGNEGTRYFLEWDANLWLNQIFFDLPLSEKSQLFFQQAFWYRLTKDESFVENNFLDTQTSVFFSYFPNTRWTVYAMSEYFPRHYNFNEQSAEAFLSYFIQSGVGLKYQLIPNLIELEALYTNFWNGSESEGAGETVNLGIRVIRQ